MPKAVVITGIRDIDRRLRTLLPRLQKKVLRQAMRKGLKVVQAEVKAEVPVETGLTRSAVQVRAVKSKRRGSIALEVRISGKVPGLVKTYGGDKRAFYPAVVEYGRKGVAPNPFMRRAFTAKGEAARQVTIEDIRMGVEREASRS
jgi:HK97 gp10 family phage protein